MGTPSLTAPGAVNGHISDNRTNLGSKLRYSESLFNFLQNSFIFSAVSTLVHDMKFHPLQPWTSLPVAVNLYCVWSPSLLCQFSAIILFLCLFDEEKSSLKLFFCILQKGSTMINPAGNYMFEVNDKNTRTRCQICSKLKLVSAIFYQIFISHQMIALQKLRRMLFISSKKLFFFSRYSNFRISIFPSFSPCQPLL